MLKVYNYHNARAELGGGDVRITQSGVRVTNATAITGGLEVDAEDVTFLNTDEGRVVGGVRLLKGGNTIINQTGGIIRVSDGQDEFTNPAITGSSGSDIVIDHGLIAGQILLGDGSDRYVKGGTTLATYGQVDLGAGDDIFENAGDAGSFWANGGSGRDQLRLSFANQQVTYGTGLIGFEDLALSGNGQFVGFSGFETISLGTPRDYGLALIQSANPNVDLSLVSNSLRLSASSLRSVVGSDADERLELSGASSVSARIDLGGGNDRLILSRFAQTDPLPSLPSTGLTGGTGRDAIDITSYSAGSLALDLAGLVGFETLALNRGYVLAVNYDIANANGLEAIELGTGSSLSLRNSLSPNANLHGGFGGAISIDQISSIGRYGAPPNSGFDTRTDIPQGDDRLSVKFSNKGTVVGGIVFYIGDDVYDGADGNVGAAIYGNAGNDLLIGGNSSEVFEGGFGADRLFGNDGDDILRGGAGNDTLSGGSGDDVIDGGSERTIAEGGAGNDRFLMGFSATGSAGSSYLGGEGTDTIDFSARAGAIAFQSVSGVPDRILADNNFIGEVEIFLGGGGADTFDMSRLLGSTVLKGNAGNDRFIGSFAAAETMYGGDGTDSFDTINGFDQAFGEGGADSFLISARTGGVPTSGIVDGGAGVDTVQVSVGFTVDLAAGTASAGDSIFSLAGIEVVLAAAFAGYSSTFYGTEQNDTLVVSSIYTDASAGVAFHGRGGDDVLIGGLGEDYLYGGAGNDVIRGGAGRTIAEGNEGNDYFLVTAEPSSGPSSSYSGGEGIDTLDLSGSSASLFFAGTTFLANALAVGNNFVSGVEALHAGAGSDTMDLSSFTIGTGLYGGAGDDTIRSGSAIDRLEGGDGMDTLHAGAGNDFLRGGRGADSLFGQDGADTFIFNLGGGTDTIGDFDLNNDKLDISAFGFQTFQQVLSYGQQSGANSVLWLPTGETIVLMNVTLAQLNGTHFLV